MTSTSPLVNDVRKRQRDMKTTTQTGKERLESARGRRRKNQGEIKSEREGLGSTVSVLRLPGLDKDSR